MRPITHLTIRVAWHDSKWNGTVCSHPSLNSYCTCLPRIRESKSDLEELVKRRSFDTLKQCRTAALQGRVGFFYEPKAMGP